VDEVEAVQGPQQERLGSGDGGNTAQPPPEHAAVILSHAAAAGPWRR
jgi:hypothetical protein